MACRVVNKSVPEGVPIIEMKDGDLGEILMWDNNSASAHRGQVVQRYKDTIIFLGEYSGKAYSTVLGKPNEGSRVRILKPGDTIQIMRPNEGT